MSVKITNDNFNQANRLRQMDHEDKVLYLIDKEALSVNSALPLLGLSPVDEIGTNTLIDIQLPYSIIENIPINGKFYFIPYVSENPEFLSNCDRLSHAIIGSINSQSQKNLASGRIYYELNKEADKVKFLNLEVEVFDFIKNKLTKLFGDHLKLYSCTIETQLQNIFIEISIESNRINASKIMKLIFELLSASIYQLFEIKPLFKSIQPNFVDKLVKTEVLFDKHKIGGSDVIDKILRLQKVSENILEERIIQNKFVMDGINSVCLATGTDVRWINSLVYSYIHKDGKPKSLVKYTKTREGNLIAKMKVPLDIQIDNNLKNRFEIKITRELFKFSDKNKTAEIIAAIGILQNLAGIFELIE